MREYGFFRYEFGFRSDITTTSVSKMCWESTIEASEIGNVITAH